MIYTAAMLSVSFHFDKYRALVIPIVMSGSSLGSFAMSLMLHHTLYTWGRLTSLKIQAFLCALTILGCFSFTMPRILTEVDSYSKRKSSIFDDTDAMKRQHESTSLETYQMMHTAQSSNSKPKKSPCSLIRNYLLIHIKHSCDVSLFASPIVILLCSAYSCMFLGMLTPFLFIVGKPFTQTQII